MEKALSVFYLKRKGKSVPYVQIWVLMKFLQWPVLLKLLQMILKIWILDVINVCLIC
uniref:Uncharacterized protein n=1 Tax=Meloidogyne enterolobii TaxID=390850 RepID=A0A6V7X9H6_MELEN|nr:unnamed protein product [Meloidogyne enterolobii]